MLPNHYMDVPLESGEGSVAYFSRAPAGTALVFVHGFNGNALTAWDRMHELLPQESKIAGVDVVFYGYRSLKARALNSANLLRQFLSDFNNPAGRLQAKAPAERRTKFPSTRYSKIVVVAHSLGGAVTRRAMLDALRLDEPWAKKTRLVLFAPAHCGASLTNLRREISGASKILSIFAALLDVKVPVLPDLAPNSDFITALREETTAALQGHSGPPLKAEAVIFGQYDNIVEVRNFCLDPPSDAWPEHTHTSLCKASESFRDPLDEVLKRL